MKKIILFINMIFVAFLLLSCTTSCSKFGSYTECSEIIVPGILNCKSGGDTEEVYEYICEDADYEKIYSFRKVRTITLNDFNYEIGLYVGDIYTWKRTIYYNENTKKVCIVIEQNVNKSVDDSIYSYIKNHPVFETGVTDSDYKYFTELESNYAYREEYYDLSNEEDISFKPVKKI
ncbi:MAG: hypothetical protein IJP63_01495 [Acholeplasmatales bacterium]|nr:hypothetical protein [Acholeplasmatales bacterium]